MLKLGIIFGEIPLVVNFINLAWEHPLWPILATYHRIIRWWPLGASHLGRTHLLADFSNLAWEHSWCSIMAT